MRENSPRHLIQVQLPPNRTFFVSLLLLLFFCWEGGVGSFFSPLLFSSRKGRAWALSSDCKIDQTSFTDWISFSYYLTSWRKSALFQISAAQKR